MDWDCDTVEWQKLGKAVRKTSPLSLSLFWELGNYVLLHQQIVRAVLGQRWLTGKGRKSHALHAKVSRCFMIQCRYIVYALLPQLSHDRCNSSRHRNRQSLPAWINLLDQHVLVRHRCSWCNLQLVELPIETSHDNEDSVSSQGVGLNIDPVPEYFPEGLRTSHSFTRDSRQKTDSMRRCYECLVSRLFQSWTQKLTKTLNLLCGQWIAWSSKTPVPTSI